jgi:hypothetical protein
MMTMGKPLAASLKFHDFESGNAMTVLENFAGFFDRL